MTINKKPYLLTAVLAGLFLLTSVVYWQGLSGPFLLDDTQNVLNIYMAEFNWSELVYIVTHNNSGIFGRPIPVLSFLFSGFLHGAESWGFKFHNLIIHLCNGLLLFVFFKKVLPYLSSNITRRQINTISIILVACWLLHPLMVSSVLYVVQRMAQLSAFFTLLSLITYLVARDNVTKKPGFAFFMAYFCFPLALLFALLSKENGALIPFYILAIELIVFNRAYLNVVEKRRVLTHLSVFSIMPLLLGSYYVITHFGGLTNYGLRDYSMFERLLTQLHVVPFYLKLTLLPQLSEMSLFHDDMSVVRDMDAITLLLFLGLIASVALVFILRKKAPVIAFGIAWFLISHLMESTFISLELVFEHRNYLAAVGPIFSITYYLIKYPIIRLQLSLPIAYVLLLVFLTWTRVQEWQTEEMIYTVAIHDHPRSFRAQTGYANMLYKVGRVEESLAHLDSAIRINSKDFGPVLHKAAFACHDDAMVEKLMAEARLLAEKNSVTINALNSLEFVLRQAQREECSGLTIQHVEEVAQISIKQPETRSNLELLGYLQRINGHAQMLQGNYTDAVDSMLSAYNNTKVLNILIELVNMQINVGRLEDAEVVFSKIADVNKHEFGISTSRVTVIENKLRVALGRIEQDKEY